MNKQRVWLISILVITVILFGYACQDQSVDSISSESDQIATLEMTEGDVINSARKGPMNFRTHLSGENEVPAVDTDAQGQAIFQVSRDGSSIEYKLIVANIENVLMAHIHNAPAGENGGVVAWLYPSSPPPELIPGRTQGVLAEGTITEDDLVGGLGGQSLEALIEEIKAGNTYVNVHTSQNPAGEVRGQIR